ncbi:hypothetical protein FQA39_LY12140 [Lamprigera yunnana]|nr:hypothetical protein FQA39_LY12140 [Lamprigera yunnana]
MADEKEITLDDIMKKLIQVEGKIDETNKSLNQQTEKIRKLEETVNIQKIMIEMLEKAKDEKEDIKTLKWKVSEVIRNKMEVKVEENEIDFINKLRQRKENINRPAKMGTTTTIKRWEIMQNAKKLAGTKIGLRDDLDMKIRKKKKQLIPYMKGTESSN